MSIPAAATNAAQPTGPAGNPARTYTAALYVGDLHPEVTENMLFEAFSTIGHVQSVRVCRDATNPTRPSLGYGYVNFHSPEDAERAIQVMNHKLIRDRPCRVMWSQPNPEQRKSGQGNIFINHLPASYDSKRLQDMFSTFGNISSAKVSTTDGVSNGYGFVQFESKEAADKATEAWNGREVEGKVLSVAPFKAQVSRGTSARSIFTNVFVKNLPAEWSKDDLIAFFQKFGTITSGYLAMDEENKSSKMFGFVNYTTPEIAMAAVEKSNNVEVGNPAKKLFVSRALTKIQRMRQLQDKRDKVRADRHSRHTNLYVKNLPDEVDDDALRNFFSQFGTVSSARVMVENGRSKNFGFASFATMEEATKALTQANGSQFFGKPLFVGPHQTKEERRAFLETQMMQRRMGGAPMGARAFMGPNANNMFMGANAAPYMYPIRSWGGQGMIPMNAMYPGQLIPVRGAAAGQNRGRGVAAAGAAARGPRAQQQGGMFPQQGGVQNPRAPRGAQPRPARAANTGAQLDAAALAQLDENEAKQIIGERLYPLVSQQRPGEAPKITGMLLEMEISEVLELLESPAELAEKVNEAYEVLRTSQN